VTKLLEFMNGVDRTLDPFMPDRGDIMAGARRAGLLPEEIAALESSDAGRITQVILSRNPGLVVGTHCCVQAPEEEEEEEEEEDDK